MQDNLKSNTQTVPQAGQIYKHFKGNLYQIVAVAEHTESGEKLVIYQALYGNYKIYARPLASFRSKVDQEKYPDVAQEYRFERLPVMSNVVSQGTQIDYGVQSGSSVQQGGGTQPGDSMQQGGGAQSGSSIQANDTTQAVQEGEKALQGQEQASEDATASAQQPQLDDGVWEFLDADSFEERLRIFTGMQHRLNNDMINIMSVSMDTEVPEGELSERIASLKNFLLMQVKFECSRVR